MGQLKQEFSVKENTLNEELALRLPGRKALYKMSLFQSQDES